MQASSVAVDDALRRALRACLADGVDAPAGFGVQLADPDPGGTLRGLHLLWQRNSVVVRARSARRILDALTAYLAVHALAPGPGQFRVDAVALVGANGAVLAPASLRCVLPRLESPLRKAGLRPLDVPLVTLEVASGAVVLATPPVAVDPSGWPGAGASRGAEAERPVAPARYPVAGWMVPGRGEAPPSRAVALSRSFDLVRQRQDLSTQEVLDGLAAVWRHAAPAYPDPDDAALVRALAGLHER